MEFLRNIKIIDQVILSKAESSLDVINLIKPDFYVKGPDYKDYSKDKTKKIILEENAVKKNGGKIKFTNDVKFSSSNILNSNNFIFNESQRNFINNLKKKFDYKKIEKINNNFKKLSVLVIGELIIDKYCFGNIIGKSGKEPHLVLKEEVIEYYVGGSGAVAKHLSSFVKEVTVISPYGYETFYNNILKKEFTKNIKTCFIKPDSNFNTITKARFVDKNSNYKLFGSYILPEKVNQKTENNILDIIKKNNKKMNMTLVCDYGHNFISEKIAKEINKKNSSTFLNAQINSSNKGFHNINKYHAVNSIVINESELRQELKDNNSDIKILIKY